MSDGWQEKLISGLFKALASLLAGGGVLQASGGEFYGKLVFAGFRDALSLSIPSSHPIDGDTYALWSQSVFEGLFTPEPAALAFLPLLALFLLLAHVVYKQSLPQSSNAAQHKRIRRFYVRHYLKLTLATFGLGAAVTCFLASGFWLIAFAVALFVPMALYLFTYSKDLLSSRFGDRYACMSMLVLLPLLLVAVPYLYGRRDFDLLLLPVEMTMAEEEAGNMFVLNQRKNLVAEVIPNEKRFTVRLMEAERGMKVGKKDASLRAWVLNHPKRAPGDPEKAKRDFRDDLNALGGLR